MYSVSLVCEHQWQGALALSGGAFLRQADWPCIDLANANAGTEYDYCLLTQRKQIM